MLKMMHESEATFRAAESARILLDSFYVSQRADLCFLKYYNYYYCFTQERKNPICLGKYLNEQLIGGTDIILMKQ